MKKYFAPIVEVIALNPKENMMDSVLTASNSEGAKVNKEPFGAPSRIWRD